MKKYGTKESKELATFGFSVVVGLKKSLADREVSFFDAVYFRDALSSASPALAGVKEVDDEMLDLDSAELADLEAFILEKMEALEVKGDWKKYLKAFILIAQGVVTAIS